MPSSETSLTCPVCASEIQARNLLRHLAHNHKLNGSKSMPNDEKDAWTALRIPMLCGYRHGKRQFAVCLECENGVHGFSRDAEAVEMTHAQFAIKHAGLPGR